MVDRTTDLLAELTGVLSDIDRVEDEIAGLESAARATAERRLAIGRAEAARCIAVARSRGEGRYQCA